MMFFNQNLWKKRTKKIVVLKILSTLKNKIEQNNKNLKIRSFFNKVQTVVLFFVL